MTRGRVFMYIYMTFDRFEIYDVVMRFSLRPNDILTVLLRNMTPQFVSSNNCSKPAYTERGPEIIRLVSLPG